MGAAVSVGTRTRDGKTALHYAALGGGVRAAKALLAAGADPNARDNWRDTPLHDAALAGTTEVARLLLNAGAEVSATDDCGRSALGLAIDRGDRAMLELLEEVE